MPFRSKAQRRWMYAAEARGDVPAGTAENWETHTPRDKKLPERVMTKQAFWDGFGKRAAAAAEPQTFIAAEGSAPVVGAPEKMLQWNHLGGVDPRTPEDMQAADSANLVTLPADVHGAMCGNCVFFRHLDEKLGSGFCTNPEVKQDVTVNMHCALWVHPGSHSAPENAAAEEQQAAEEEAALAQQQAAMGGAPAAGDEGQPQLNPELLNNEPQGAPEEELADQAVADFQGADSGGGKPPAKKKEAKKEKEGGKDKGHTININVGGKKA